MSGGKEIGVMIALNGQVATSLKNALKFAQSETAKTSSKMAAFSQSMGKVSSGINKISKFAATALVSGMTAGAVALTKTANNAMDAADELEKMRATTGLSYEDLQRFQYVGNQLSVNFESFGTAISAMTKNMSAADKEGSAAAQAFASLGIATQNANGELRPQAEMFRESLMALSSMENQSERSALAFKIFGKGAQELFPILDAGTSEINRLTFEADKLGIVMGGKQVQALDNLGDTVDRLKLSFKGTTNQIISALAPSLQNIFANLSRNMPKIQETAKAIFGNLASSLSNILPKLIDIANKIMPTITSIMSNVSNVLGPAVLNVLGDLSDIVANVFNFINENWTFIEPIVWGIVGAITAWNLATKAAMIIEALSKAWAFASTVIGMLQAGTSLATVAQWAFNAAMAANPIGIIIVAIGALIAAIVLVAKNWDEIVKFIVGIWENNIVPFFNSIGDWFSNLWAGITGAFQSAWQAVSDWFTGLWNGIVDAFKSVINFFIKGINGIISGINFVTGAIGDVIGVNLRIPEIPLLAKGGFTNGPSIAGEAGPEAVIPLKPKNPRSISLLKETANKLGVGASGSGTVVNNYFSPNIYGGNTKELKDMLEDEYDDFESRMNQYFTEQRRLAY